LTSRTGGGSFVAADMEQSEDRYAIARIDLPGASTHGWQVRLQRRGRRYAKYFGDRQHGGADHALASARAWRDALLAELAAVPVARVCRVSVRNSSGVVGVSRISVNAANGETYFFWQATWSSAAGLRRCVKFSIKRHGDRQAFRLAVEARRSGTADGG